MPWAKTRNVWSLDPADANADKNLQNTNQVGSIWGTSTPASSKEDGAIHRMLVDYLRTAVKRQGPSGWSTLGAFTFSGAFGSAFRIDKSEAFADGLPIVEVGSNIASEILSEAQVAAPPGSGTRTDLIYVEIFIVEVPGSTTSTPVSTNKPSTTALFKYGNVLFGGTNITDDINEIDAEIRRRVQVQYRMRAVSGVDFTTFPKGVNDTVTVLAQGPLGNPSTIPFAQDANDPGLFVAGSGSAANQSALGTLDGKIYALPIAKVVRTAGQTDVLSGDVTDLRDTWGLIGQTVTAGVNTGIFQYATASTVKLARGYGDSIKIEIDGILLTSGVDITFNIASDLDTGVETSSTYYYCYVGNVAGTITPHISVTAPEISANKVGYHPANTNWRYVGSFRNNSISDIDPFIVSHGWVRYSQSTSERIHTLGTVVPTAWTSQAVILPTTATLMRLVADVQLDDTRIVYGPSDAAGTLPSIGGTHLLGGTGMEGVHQVFGGESGSNVADNNGGQFTLPVADPNAPAFKWGLLNYTGTPQVVVNKIQLLGYYDPFVGGR